MTSASATFELATEMSGIRHTLTVEVWPSRPSMLAHLTANFPDGNWGDVNAAGEAPSAAFLNAGGFHTLHAPENLGTIYYCADFLDIGTVVHEMVHAAMFIYFCDILGTHSRAVAHMNSTNEIIAYLIDNLMTALAAELLARGLYDDVIPVGSEEQR